MEDRIISRKTRVGIVVSDRMSKTVVIKVDRMAKHPLYGKPVLRSKKFMAHDEEEACRLGDRIRIEETRPLSRRKCWRVVEIIERAPVFGGSQEKEA
ncbi:MAG: 30S ribosomal protein S17 [Thermovirgaceae bacterium]|nr:30S ribosomal protein S17 [Thermovirgaceae bacterium]